MIPTPDQREADATTFIPDPDGSIELHCFSCLLVIRDSMRYLEDKAERDRVINQTHEMERSIETSRFHFGGPSRLMMKVIAAWMRKYVAPHRDDAYLSGRMRNLYPLSTKVSFKSSVL